jgi:hypothetical protein
LTTMKGSSHQGTLAAMMATVCEWNGANRESVPCAMRRSLLVLPAEETPWPQASLNWRELRQKPS